VARRSPSPRRAIPQAVVGPARVSAGARHSSCRNPAAAAPYAVGLGVRPDSAPCAGLRRPSVSFHKSVGRGNAVPPTLGVPFHKALRGRARHSPPPNPAAGAPFRSRTALYRGRHTRKRRFRSMNPRPARRFPSNMAGIAQNHPIGTPGTTEARFCPVLRVIPQLHPCVSFHKPLSGHAHPCPDYPCPAHPTKLARGSGLVPGRRPVGRVVALPRRKRLDPLVGRYRKDGGVAPRSPLPP